MKILLTGATGFIGFHLRKHLSEHYEVVALVREKTSAKLLLKEGIKTVVIGKSSSELQRQIASLKVSGVIHLASLYLKKHDETQIEELITSNITFPTQLLDVCTQVGVSWFINTGTFWQHYQNKTYSPVNLYAATKQAFCDIAQYYAESSGLKFTTIKLSDTFGPKDTRSKIFNLWRQAQKNAETLKMSGGEQQMDICYIDDVCKAYLRLIEYIIKNPSNTLPFYSVAATQRFTLRELADIFSKATDQPLNIEWGAVPYREREVMIPWNGGEKVPNWKPEVDIQDGIKRTFKDSYDQS